MSPTSGAAEAAAKSLRAASAIYLGSAALNAGVPFLVLPLLTRWLGPAEFGIVGGFLALVNLATVLVGLSVHGIVSVVHFRQSPQAVPPHVAAAIKLLWITAAPVLLLLLALAPWVERFAGVPAAWVWTVGLVALCQSVVALGLVVYQTRERAVLYGCIQVGVTLGWAAASLALIGLLHLGWEGRALGQLAAVALAAAAVLWLLHRDRLLGAMRQAAPLKVMLAFGLPLVPHSLAAAVMAGADRWVLTSVGGTATAGLYFAAFQVAAVLSVGAAAINQAWVPWLYRRLASGDATQAREVVRVTYVLYALLLAAAMLLAVFAPWLVALVAGPRFAEAAPLLQWLAPAAALSGMYYFVTNYLFYAGRTSVLSAITVGCSLLQLALMLWAVPRWGARGAAMSVLSSAFVYWVLTWRAAHRAVPMPWTLRAR